MWHKTKYTWSLELWSKWSGEKVGLYKVTRGLEKQRVSTNIPQPQQLLEASSEVKRKQVSTKEAFFSHSTQFQSLVHMQDEEVKFLHKFESN